MAEVTASLRVRRRRYAALIGQLVGWGGLIAFGLIIAAQLVFFVVHATHLLTYPYPLDYGEGPLLTQVQLLRSGVPIWNLYADPAQPPYAVVNYPPVYHLPASIGGVGGHGGNHGGGHGGAALQVGRVISLVSALGILVALWMLLREPGTKNQEPSVVGRFSVLGSRFLTVLAFLALPIVREWSVVMRVDMLGVCLGLWGLVIVQQYADRRAVLWATPLLLLSLYVKPSLIAAPAATCVWLLLRDWRRALLLTTALGISGGLVFALLQFASGGWFSVHVLTANVNEWQETLARQFWDDQMAIHWPLLGAAFVALFVTVIADEPNARRQRLHFIILPLLYALFGAITAIGVGKVGAYTNYFLEFYAGLIWLAAGAFVTGVRGQGSGVRGQGVGGWGLGAGGWDQGSEAVGQMTDDGRRTTGDGQPVAGNRQRTTGNGRRTNLLIIGGQWAVVVLVIAALLRYYPTWSENHLKLAGIIEGENPARIVFGGYSVWDDLQRERDILDTLSRVNGALVNEVQAVGEPIFTDVPGVAAQAGQLSRLQAFEHRQLYDVGEWDQRGLLLDLANGRVPLIVLDYLGNWMTPEMIELIQRRYAQDGSRGTYDLYRPIDPGPRAPLDVSFPNGARLTGFHLAPSPGRSAYHAGELVSLTLVWRQTTNDERRTTTDGRRRADDDRPPTTDHRRPTTDDRPPTTDEVVLQIQNAEGQALVESVRPLLYDALPPEDWPVGQDVQHMQPIQAPPDLLPGAYELAVTLRADGRDLAPPQTIGQMTVVEQAGRIVGEQGYYAPAPLFAEWERLGGYEGLGDALTPATPFRGFVGQCFVRGCLRLVGEQVERLPLGELIRLGDVGLRPAPDEGESMPFPETGLTLSGAFLDAWRERGGEEMLGPPISGRLVRGKTIVQYTRYARLEQPIDGENVRLARLGEEFLRLPGGVRYRWP
jgi:hypothetical protein